MSGTTETDDSKKNSEIFSENFNANTSGKNNNPLWQVHFCRAWMKNIVRTELIAPQERLRVCHIVSPGIYTFDDVDDVTQWIQQCPGVSHIDLTVLVPDTDTANRLVDVGIKVVYPLSRFAEVSDSEILLHTLRSRHPNWTPYHVVWCWEGFDVILSSEAHITHLLRNVSALLMPGGYLVGQCFDSSEIYARVWKRKTTDTLSVVTKGGLMRLQFQNDRFEHIGSAYRVIINNQSGDGALHYLIHFPTFLRLAKQFQLRMIEITNANEFYEENKRVYFDTLKRWGVLQKSHKFKFLPEQKDVLSLYALFTFQKSRLDYEPSGR
jgi:hypothetical protein